MIKVSFLHSFEDSNARIQEEKGGFIARCECGWSSPPKPTKEDAIISFENHVSTNPSHKFLMEDKSSNFNSASIAIAVLGVIYVLSPIDLVPDYLVGVGWIEDILIGIFSIMLIKGGLEGKSPQDSISSILK